MPGMAAEQQKRRRCMSLARNFATYWGSSGNAAPWNQTAPSHFRPLRTATPLQINWAEPAQDE